ncbi:MAG TPA: hypothetical protein VK470_20290 [Bacteroidota bacterium]|nr:hypothetical protein [Bacteroidota bacterium]
MSLLPSDSIPTELWENNILSLPSDLIQAYQSNLTRLGLLTSAQNGPEEGKIYGGGSVDETHNHFAHRFGVSAGRPEFLILDPKYEFENVSEEIQLSFLDGKIALLDIPCGCGAATCSLLSTIAKLRENNVVAKLPLEIIVTGGDYSKEALDIFDKLMGEIQPSLNNVGITLKWNCCIWDVRQTVETTRMIDSWFMNSSGADEYFVVICNFSGDGSKAGLIQSVSVAVENILARLHDRKSTLVWIEPKSLSALTFFKKIIGWFSRIYWFTPDIKSGTPFLIAEYEMKHPVHHAVHPSTLLVQRYHRK